MYKGRFTGTTVKGSPRGVYMPHYATLYVQVQLLLPSGFGDQLWFTVISLLCLYDLGCNSRSFITRVFCDVARCTGGFDISRNDKSILPASNPGLVRRVRQCDMGET